MKLCPGGFHILVDTAGHVFHHPINSTGGIVRTVKMPITVIAHANDGVAANKVMVDPYTKTSIKALKVWHLVPETDFAYPLCPTELMAWLMVVVPFDQPSNPWCTFSTQAIGNKDVDAELDVMQLQH
ncbi:hypothetical protein CPB84DRAFT_1754629 [Gymnopilus junonius]|uniref:Uncharacterized protein n=1 Tax=Gymnopilus junonius TaxID=109634 RepID=A0A9P5N725_GYMJU|nr:hypothetical protein CPB84DRAFT_1754629 [Gymnopilus junonius]